MTPEEFITILNINAAATGLSVAEYARRINEATPEEVGRALEACPTDALEFGVKFEALSRPCHQSLTLRQSIVAEFHASANRHLELFSLRLVKDKLIRNDEIRVVTRVDYYDVEYSKTHGYMYHLSGGGPALVTVSGLYWVDGPASIVERPCALVDGSDSPPWRKTKAIRDRNRTRRLRSLPVEFLDNQQVDSQRPRNLWDWLTTNGMETDTVYCSVCKDSMPREDQYLCSHIWWCERTCEYSTPDERCTCKRRAECDEEDEDGSDL